MKILHINCNYLDTKLHQLLIRELDALNFEDKVFVPTYDKSRAIINIKDNEYVFECFKKNDRFIFGYKQKKILETIESAFDISEFDMIHAYTIFTDGNIARILSEKYHIPYVVAVRNTDVNVFFKYMIPLRNKGVKVLKEAKSIFFLSDAYKNTIFSKYIPNNLKKELETKTYIIPNGIDEFWFENPYDTHILKKNKIDLIYAGRIDRNKNIETTQLAMKFLRNKGINTHLTVIGKVIEKSVYKKIIKDKFTSVLPPMSKEELIKFYRKSDIFVMPSFTESFGLVYAEAMSQGLPVVYSEGQGFDKQFPEGVVGYSVNPNSAQSVSDGIYKCIENQKEISLRAKKNAKKFNWKEISEKYKEIYLS